jgi:hypothetical protein
MRVKAAIWVAAFIRRVNASGASAVLVRRGAEEAGPILIRIDRLDGTGDLYVPAPQSAYDEDHPGERLFVRRFGGGPVSSERLVEAIARETRIDPDLWLIDVEDRQGRSFLDEQVVE